MTDRSVLVRLRADVSQYVRSIGTAAAVTGGFVKQLDSADSRMSNIVQTGLALAPALVPIAATITPAIAGMAMQLGFAAAGAGTLLLAFNGVGDALKALNQYQLEPTAANLDKLHEAMDTLGPDGQDFVRTLQQIRPEMQQLQNISQEGFFPGATEGLDELMKLLPQAQQYIGTISSTLGMLVAEAGDNLNDPRWRDFFDYLDREAAPTLQAMGRSAGNFVEGLANMLMAVDPLSDMFRGGLLEASRDFREWTDGLADSDGFQGFLDYIEENGPQAMETLGAIGGALVSLVESAAPVGALALPVIEALAKTLSAIAESPAGPVLITAAAGISAVARAAALYKAANGSALLELVRGFDKDGRRAGAGARAAGAGLGIMALALTDVDDSLGLSNTAMGATMGLIGGPWGAAIGGGIGLALDFADSQARAAERVSSVAETLNQQTGAITANTREWIKNELYTSGAFDAAERLGLDLANVTDAALGNEAALALVNGQLESLIGKTTGPNARLLADPAFQKMNADATGLKETINATGGAIASGRDKIRQFGAAGGNAGRRVAGGMNEAAEATYRFSDALAEVNALLERRSSFRDYEAAIDDFVDTLDGIKDPSNILTKGGKINIDLPKGREVQAQLDNIASTANRVAENLKGADRVEFLKRARADFVRVATLLLEDKDAARALVRELIAADRQRVNPKIRVDTGAAMADIGNIHRALSRIPDETVFVNVTRRRAIETGGFGPSADGNFFPTVKAYAWGDVSNGHQAEMTRRGVTRVWNEPETGGESYIPHANDARRPRAMGILEQTASLFGGTVSWFGAGGHRHGSTMAGHRGAGGGVRVDLGDLRVVGTLNTPWGPAQVDGIARAAAREEIDADGRFERVKAGR